MNFGMRGISEPFVSYMGWTVLAIYLVGTIAYKLGKTNSESETKKEFRKYVKDHIIYVEDKEKGKKKRWRP